MTDLGAVPPHDTSVAAGRASISRREAWALVPVLGVTFLGTANNNIVNVPMSTILDDFDARVSKGALVVIVWALTTAVLLPLMGWLGDRIGRRRLFTCAVVSLSISAFGAALAPDLGTLVAFRALQGAGSAAVLPTVMGLVGDITVHRARALSWWAMANGLGQAIGAPLGGAMAAWLGWRSIFWPMGVLGLVALVATFKLVPSVPGRPVPLEWKGATSLTLGTGLVLGSVAVVPQLGVGSPAVWALVSTGLVVLALFLVAILRSATPFVPPRLLVDPNFLRPNLAVLVQMFALGATMLAIPLHLVQQFGMSTARAGVIVFALPAAMALMAPVCGLLVQRLRPLPTMRGGLVLIVVAQASLALLLARGVDNGLALAGTLAACGLGIAFVQTPAATLAVSATGTVGAGVGLFNLVRFSGSMIGATWVAIAFDAGLHVQVIFVACSVAAALGLVGTLAGRSGTGQPAPLSG